MIKESDLLEAIAECQGERNPNANTCIKLAAYYTILNNIQPESLERSKEIMYDSGSEFSDIARRLEPEDVMRVMDDLMDALQVLSPRLYKATMDKLKG